MTETNHDAGKVLRFENCRRPESAADLSPVERGQLELAGRLYDGAELSASERLGDGEVDEEETLQFVSLWDLTDPDGVVKYQAWFYMVDTGTIFRAGTTEIVAEVIQCGLECGDAKLAEQIFGALDRLRKTDPERAKLVNIIRFED